MAHLLEAIPITLSNIQGHSSISCLFGYFFRIAAQQLTRFQLTMRRAVPLPQLSFISKLLPNTATDR